MGILGRRKFLYGSLGGILSLRAKAPESTVPISQDNAKIYRPEDRLKMAIKGGGIGDQPVQIIWKGDPPSLVVNRDLVSQIFYADSSDIYGGNQNVLSIIDPLGSETFNGTKDVWVIRAPGSTTFPVVDVKPGSVSWSPSPAQVAAQIAKFGTPLLAFKNVLGPQVTPSGTTLPANSLVTLLNNVSVNQIGYEALFRISTTAASQAPVTVYFLWSDSASGLSTDAQNWTFLAGITTGIHNVRITGPSNGDQLTVLITNGGNPVTVTYAIVQVSRVYTQHFGHTIFPQGNIPVFPAATLVSCDPSSGIICAESQAVPSSSAVNLLLPLYSGLARMWGISTLNTGTDSEWRLTYNTALLTLHDSIPYRGQGNSGFSPFGQGSFESENVAMPRTQMGLQLNNHNTTTVNTMSCHLVAQEVQS